MFNSLMCLRSLPQQGKMSKVQIMLLQQHENYHFLIITREFKKIYLVNEEIGGFVSPWYKYKNGEGHLYMYLFYGICFLIGLSILIFAPDFMVSECWIFENVLMSELGQKFWPLRKSLDFAIYFYLHICFIYLLFVKLTYA